ncbi:hypothetical protein [Flavihumibacter fluvii]|uniref:hypothetical protein n=1 Tax=Flavihumibacter fluvii TaxID=2838157 RepID=UPI001BDE3D28|nr:hypothetical protein [Flavihumibacter fluvii]ULQ53129.1 hypothetical protein KJS93_02205 [Flavihumibacter fluvii]
MYHIGIATGKPVLSFLTGDSGDVNTQTTSGILLMGGGTDVDAAFRWMIQKSGGY